MDLEVRRAGAGDAAALARLRWIWRAEERGETGMSWPQFRSAFGSWLRLRGDTHYAFLARRGDAVIGMAWLAVVERVPGPGRWTRLGGQLQSVYVLPEHRRRGVGRALVAAARAEAEALGVDWVIVHPSDASASLYAGTGFLARDGLLEWRP